MRAGLLLSCLSTLLTAESVVTQERQECQSVLESLECHSDHWKSLQCSYKAYKACDDKKRTLVANHHK